MRKRGANYTDAEHSAIARAYLRLAIAQYEGRAVNKAALVRGLRVIMPARSRGSIEAKFMNFSAAAVASTLLPALPGGYVKGYKPAPNGSKSLSQWLMVAIERTHGARLLLNSVKAAAA